MNFTDTAPIAGTRRTADGYLVADARIARTGIQIYLGSELAHASIDDRLDGYAVQSTSGGAASKGLVQTDLAGKVGLSLSIGGTSTLQFSLGGWEDYTLNRIY
jgi:hypothetical protein